MGRFGPSYYRKLVLTLKVYISCVQKYNRFHTHTVFSYMHKFFFTFLYGVYTVCAISDIQLTSLIYLYW